MLSWMWLLGDGCLGDASAGAGMTTLSSGRCWSVTGDDLCCCCCCCWCGRSETLKPRACRPTDTQNPPETSLPPTITECPDAAAAAAAADDDDDDNVGSMLDARRLYIAKCRLMSGVVVSGCCCLCSRCIGMTRSSIGSSRVRSWTCRLNRSNDVSTTQQTISYSTLIHFYSYVVFIFVLAYWLAYRLT